MDRVTIVGLVFPLNHSVVAVDSHSAMVMRDREGEDLPVKLLFPSYVPEELHDSTYGERYAMRILPVGDFERSCTALHLAR